MTPEQEELNGRFPLAFELGECDSLAFYGALKQRADTLRQVAAKLREEVRVHKPSSLRKCLELFIVDIERLTERGLPSWE